MKIKRIIQRINETDLVLLKNKQDWQILSQTNKKESRLKLIKLEVKKVTLYHMSLNSRGSLRNTLKTYAAINWQIWKEWVNFWTHDLPKLNNKKIQIIKKVNNEQWYWNND
jgi:hypothetical protein